MKDSYHLETDASLNLAMARTNSGGVREWFAGGGVVVLTAGLTLVATYVIPLGYLPSAEHAEALTLLRDLKIVQTEHGATSVAVHIDSLVLYRHLTGEYRVESSTLAEVLNRIQAEKARFAKFAIERKPTTHRKAGRHGYPSADSLARMAASLSAR